MAKRLTAMKMVNSILAGLSLTLHIYDPTYSYEVAVPLFKMACGPYVNQKKRVFFSITLTVMNELRSMKICLKVLRTASLKGCYKLKSHEKKANKKQFNAWFWCHSS